MRSLSFSPLITLSTLLAMTLLSCSKESIDEPVPTPPVVPTDPSDENIEIRISPLIQESRATDYGFETGDCIGLYVVNYNGTTAGTLSNTGNHVNNMRHTYNGQWNPDSPIYWLNKETHADFYIYYPYADVKSVNAHPFAVKENQSTEAAYKASDFMTGKTLNVSPTSSATVIPANHVMSRIEISLEAGNGFTKESIAASNVSVKINGVKCNSTVDIATGAVTPIGNPSSVIPLKDGNSYKALIVPQAVGEGNLITVTVDGRDFNFNKAFSFESARSHKFTIVLDKTSNGVNVNITPWEDNGVDNGGTAD